MPVTLFCNEAPELKLGPGSPDDPLEDVIVFRDGFAEIPALTAEIERWIKAPGTPPIEVLDGAEGRVPEVTPGAEVCPRCEKAFGTKRQLQGHLMSHRPSAN